MSNWASRQNEVWAQAIGVTDGRALLDRLIERMRSQRVIIPGISVVERMAAAAMHAADDEVIGEVDALLSSEQHGGLDTPPLPRRHTPAKATCLGCASHHHGSASAPYIELLDKLGLLRATGVSDLPIPDAYRPRLAQMAREGVRGTAQAFQQMRFRPAPRRHGRRRFANSRRRSPTLRSRCSARS